MVCQHCGKFLDVYQVTCPRCRNPVRKDGRPIPPEIYARSRSRVNRLHREKKGGGLTDGLLWIFTGFGLFSKQEGESVDRILALPGPQPGAPVAGGRAGRASRYSRAGISTAKTSPTPQVTPGTSEEGPPVLEAEFGSGSESTHPEGGKKEAIEPAPLQEADIGDPGRLEKEAPQIFEAVSDSSVSGESKTGVSPEPLMRDPRIKPKRAPGGEPEPEAYSSGIPQTMEDSALYSEADPEDFEEGGLKKRSKKLLSSVLQIFVVMGIVSFFFSGFTVLMFYIFPMEGEGSTNWIRQAAIEIPLNAADTGLLNDTRTVAAYLTYQKNDVRVRPSEQIFWNEAELNMALYNQDAVQTLEKSRAIITFDPTNFLDVDENSLVIIKKMEENQDLGERRSFLVMVDGNLRGRIEASDEKNIHVQVATSAGMATISSTSSSQKKAEFALKINPDRSTSLTVFKGEAALSAQGETVVVKENQTTKVHPEKAPIGPVPIPASVNLKGPSPQSVYFYRDFPKQIQFKWNKNKAGKKYHLQIARDELFRERVLDEITERTSFTFGNLREGSYNWRVSVIAEAGIEGTPSEIRPIRVVRDQEPPQLVLHSPSRDRSWKWGKVIVKGKTDMGTKVYVNGKPATIKRNGEFSRTETVKPGVNVIVVEAIDRAGNTAFVSRTLTRKR